MLELFNKNAQIHPILPTNNAEDNVIIQNRKNYFKLRGTKSLPTQSSVTLPQNIKKVNHFNIYYKNNKSIRSKVTQSPRKKLQLPEILNDQTVDTSKIRSPYLRIRTELTLEKTDSKLINSPSSLTLRVKKKFRSEPLYFTEEVSRSDTPFSKVSYLKSDSFIQKESDLVTQILERTKFSDPQLQPQLLQKETSHLFWKSKFHTKYHVDPTKNESQNIQKYDNLKYQKILVTSPRGYLPYPIFD